METNIIAERADPPPIADTRLAREAKRLKDWIVKEAWRAREDPVRARDKGIARMPEGSLFAALEPPAAEPNVNGEWLRGAATALLPTGWRFRVDTAVGGGAKLVILGYDPPRPQRSEAPKLFRRF